MATINVRIIYVLAAALFGLTAVITSAGSTHDMGIGAVWLAIGAVFVALSEQSRRKTKQG